MLILPLSNQGTGPVSPLYWFCLETSRESDWLQKRCENYPSKTPRACMYSGPEPKAARWYGREECPNAGKSRQLQKLWTS